MDTINLTKQFYDFEIFATSDATDLPELLGENHKKLLIVVENADYSEEAKILLSKIIQAVGFNLSKDALLLCLDSDRVISFQQIKSVHKIETLLCFGISLDRLGVYLQIPPYQIIQHGDFRLILTDKLQHIAQHKSTKAALWKALQALFLAS